MPRHPLADRPGYAELVRRLRADRLQLDNEWLEPVEAAQLIDVRPQAISRAIRKGHLRARPFGQRSYLIHRPDLDEYDRQRQRGRASPWYGERSAGTLSEPPPHDFPFLVEKVRR
jgi:excisionase family DNA binding protein